MKPQRGTGSVPGKDVSTQRVDALDALDGMLSGVSFPAPRAAVASRLRGKCIRLGAEGQEVDAGVLVESLMVDEFSSPGHVREAIDLNWQDFADVLRPGGGG